MQNFDFLSRYSLVGKTILRYFDNLHSVNICRKKVLLSLKEIEFDGNTDSAKIEERSFWVRVKKRQEDLNIDGLKHIFQGKRELRISWIMVLNPTIQHQ